MSEWMTLEAAKQHALEKFHSCLTGEVCAAEHGMLADWLGELQRRRDLGGISICILTWNVLPYTKVAISQIRKLTRMVDYEILIYDNGSTDGTPEWLSDQDDVILLKGANNSMRHGEALDRLVRHASKNIACTLCSDAFPVSPAWTTPALFLDEDTVLAGIDRGWGRKLKSYVCPSYLFGWTRWVRDHTFMDHWPETDTGEQMAIDCEAEGKRMKMWKYELVSFGEGYKPNPCDYAGWVWHTWWGGRSQSVPGLAGKEFEPTYHARAIEVIGERFGIEVR